MMTEMNRRDSLKTMTALGVSTVFCSKALADQSSVKQPIKLGVITDLHGGLAKDAMDRLVVFIKAMAEERSVSNRAPQSATINERQAQRRGQFIVVCGSMGRSAIGNTRHQNAGPELVIPPVSWTDNVESPIRRNV